MAQQVRVAVTGAAGQIGYALLFRIASGEMFGPETKISLNLLELPQAQAALEGVSMELEDCAFPLLTEVRATADPREAFRECDWALLVGSVPRKAGMERGDLLKINAKVFLEQGQALSDVAKKDCRVLVVGNPCNTNAYIAKIVAKNIPDENFFALTLLDQNRAVAQIAKKTGVEIDSIRDLFIWGNHSATQYPDFYYAKIDGKSVTDVVGDETWLQEEFLSLVQKRGAQIIQKRGLSSAASAANAILNTVANIVRPEKKGTPFSLVVSSDGSYGVEEGLMFSFPVSFQNGRWSVLPNIALGPFAQEKIEATYQELLRERKEVCAFLKI